MASSSRDGWHGRRRKREEEEEEREMDEEDGEVEMDIVATWDPHTRREQRQRARERLQHMRNHREELVNPEEIIETVQSMNKEFKKMVAPREAAIDSEGFQLLSAIGREQLTSRAGDIVFDTSLFVEKLITLMGGRRGNSSGELDWSVLGDKANRVFKKPPTPSFLHGALDIGPLIHRQRQQRQGRKTTAEAAEMSKPKEISAFDEEEESTTKDVAHIFTHLKRVLHNSDGRVHYFRFLLDPNSFAQSIENLFHFAFLVKDGRAGIMIDHDDNQPYIHWPPEVSADGQSVKQSKNQSFITLNFDIWEKAIKMYSIKTAQIPPRE